MPRGALRTASAALSPNPVVPRAAGIHRLRPTSAGARRSPFLNTMISTLRALLLVAAALSGSGASMAATTITLATFPDLDRAARAALPRWHAAHPDIDVKIVSLQYADHHNAMTTALATGSGLPDVMAIDFKFIGKFTGSGGFEDLYKPPYDAGPLRAALVPFALAQATNARGELISA